MKTHGVYRHLVDPEKYPLYAKRPVKAVTRRQLGDKIQYCSIRMFKIDKNTMRMTDFRSELDAYTVHNRLGDVVWPFCDTLGCGNLDELLEEIRKRNLYFFDVWGFVPGSWSGTEPWGEYPIRPETVALLKNELGDRFLGFDNGEQDGRYVGGYAPMMCPAAMDRAAHYLNFQRHFEKLSDAMQHHVTALVSLHYGHYFVKENDVVMLGAECAQALPNVNLWYAFNRGAGRQYGVLWFGNASVWNRWGYKNYNGSGNEGYEWGPEYGTSASLLRRIMYIHYTYNCDILGFESGWLKEGTEEAAGDTGRNAGIDGQYGRKLSTDLTPVGVLQSDAVAFTGRHGYAGPMYLPVAVVLDFFAGYTPPRHLYVGSVYQTWGAMPYDEGDYGTHALFNMLFPGYEDAGFYRDERGFLTATPYGDMFDVLLSDAETEVLESYNRLVLSGRVGIGAEEFEKLRAFVEAGGTLHVFLGAVEASIGRFAGMEKEYLSFFGLESLGGRIAYPDGSAIVYGGRERPEKAFELYDAAVSKDAAVPARTRDGRPVIHEVSRGAGRVCSVAVPFGINMKPASDYSGVDDGNRAANRENEAVPPPHDLLETVRAYLGDCFNKEKLVDVSPSLGWSVNLLGENRLRVTISNNTHRAQRFDIKVCEGAVRNVEEIGIQNVDTAAVGYLPFEYERKSAEGGGAYEIEPLDVRMFTLTADGLAVGEKPEIAVPDRTAGKYLKLRPNASIREQIAACPTISTHFEGVKADARYFAERERGVLEYEAGFVRRRAMKVIVDFSSLMNHYPDVSLLDNIEGRYAANMDMIGGVLGKAALYGCERAVISLHRNAENHVAAAEADECFAKSVARIAKMCGEHGIALYVQNGTPARHGFTMPRLLDWIDAHRLGVKVAWNPGHSLICREDLAETAAKYGGRISAVLLSAPAKDIHGQFTDAHLPLCLSPFADAVASAAGALVKGGKLDFAAFDAVYGSFDETYRDIRRFE